jgi:hypothetical protein
MLHQEWVGRHVCGHFCKTVRRKSWNLPLIFTRCYQILYIKEISNPQIVQRNLRIYRKCRHFKIVQVWCIKFLFYRYSEASSDVANGKLTKHRLHAQNLRHSIKKAGHLLKCTCILDTEQFGGDNVPCSHDWHKPRNTKNWWCDFFFKAETRLLDM